MYASQRDWRGARGVAGVAIGGLGRAGPHRTGDPKMYRVGGGARDGVSTFPRVDYAQMKPLKPGEVDFKHFHTYEEATELLRKWAAAYPDLVDLYSVGPVARGPRDLADHAHQQEDRQGTPTSRRSSSRADGTRARSPASRRRSTSSITSSPTTARTPAITKLVDTKTIYAKPHNNPDGASLYHYTAQTLRSTRPADRQRRRRPDRRRPGRGPRRRRLRPADAQVRRRGQGHVDRRTSATRRAG